MHRPELANSSKEWGFLQSCLTRENRVRPLDEFLHRIEHHQAARSFCVEPIPFRQCERWGFRPDTGDLAHESGRFFSIRGLDVGIAPDPERSWEQPIIHQPEIGILGILAKRFDGVLHLLMQAKAEPGNIRPIQVSPTVQATKSNYSRVHNGKSQPYLEYFIDRSRSRVLVDRLQSEQGSRFFRKRNRNMIVEVTEPVTMHENFVWLTLHDVKRLLRMRNMVNMDARSVLACVSLAEASHDAAFGPVGRRLFASLLDRDWDDLDGVVSWFTECKTRSDMRASFVGLDRVQGWERTDRVMRHVSGDFFHVVAVRVEIGGREVSSWCQPLVGHPHVGIMGYLMQEVDGAYRFLVQAKVEPGNFDTVELSCTVSCSSPERGLAHPEEYPFLRYFSNAAPEGVHYDEVQSEEGGRFYHVQNRYMIVEVPAGEVVEVPPSYKWLTLGQMVELARHSYYFNVEARSLLACILSLMD